jgi:hypothetical protein
MAFKLQFSTRPSNLGKSIILYDESTDWLDYSATVTKVVITTSVVNNYIPLYNGTTPVTEVIKEIAGSIAEGFELEITNTDLGYPESEPIKDAIYTFKLELYNGTTINPDPTYNYESKEVSYYNSEILKNSKFVSLSQQCIVDIDDSLLDEPLFLASQLEGIFASSIYGDTGAIYNVFDNLKRKYPDASI